MGVALASFFLYPLASALEGDRYYLHWQPHHSTEAVAALALLTVGLGAALRLADRLTGIAAATVAVLISAVPLASLGAGVARQLPFRLSLIAAWQRPGLAAGVAAVAATIVLAGIALRPERIRRGLFATLLVLSPVSLIVLKAFAAAALRDAPPYERRVEPAASTAPACGPVLALLFDELSFAYLYDGSDIRPEFPMLRRFAGGATQYTAVRSPGPETLVSLPGYLAARAVSGVQVAGDSVIEVRENGERVAFDAADASGLFGRAQQLGLRTEMAGYYFPYCDLLGARVDVCRAFSFYNHATFERGWSPLNPILTTLILWPRQFPLGLLKNPAFAVQQRRLVEDTVAFAGRPLARGVFRLVHFSIPHLPFVFDAAGYDPPLDPLRTSPDTSYVAQLRYTDRLIGDLLDGLDRAGARDAATILVLSDHGFRFGGRDTDPRHVPFLVKHAGQREPETIHTPAQAEHLLPQVLDRACGR
ncbi:MAG: sulfatase-like hydrolase/transferase [Vicinamibacterales bacterium]